jgi:two-component system, chemotaxis family, chemotaxis protein CheY
MLALPLNICLIDDDRIYQFTAKKTLESTGLTGQIQAFINGKEALEYFQNNTNSSFLPHIIFLDINMPILDGWQFLEGFKPIYASMPQPPIIYLLSSSVDEYDTKRAKEYDMIKDYLIKPINKEKFTQLLTQLSQPNE